MVSVYLLKTPHEKSGLMKNIAENINKNLQKRALLSKNEKSREEKLVAYYLLEYALRHFGYGGDISLENEAYGKPFISGADVRISLSHTNGLLVAAISDGKEVGVDAEKITEDESSVKRAVERFLPSFDPVTKEISDLEIYEATILKDGKISFSKIEEESSKTAFCTRKWTAAEALLKCDGRGFAALSSIAEINGKAALYSLEYEKKNEKYSISIAEEIV